MKMKSKLLKALRVIVAGMMTMTIPTLAQADESDPLYLSLDCMKSTAADYVAVEKEIWQPMHQELVNQGRRNSWALYEVHYGDRSNCDFYTVTTFVGEDQLNADQEYAEAFKAVHERKNMEKAMARTLASLRSRTRARTGSTPR